MYPKTYMFRGIYFFKLGFSKKKKNNFLPNVKSQCAFFLVEGRFLTFGSTLRKSRHFDVFSCQIF